MIHHQLLPDQRVLVVTPESPLEKRDFEALAPIVDRVIAEHGSLGGLMIYTKSFPGWKDFSAMLGHFNFVKDHQKHITKVAAVTDSAFLSILPSVASFFVHAKVRHFDYEDKAEALAWLDSDT
ncbi:hypothetical protein Pla175_42040 [Pirellulimonas nuda]|uniref:SpoIIAA-like protein n=1 Tax=Pirellulimonas nuda TaxID=2528009 RepID=A0A518DH35_9BACT|nr:STAS/SEC14 domain-containing protein [Pirellulimonas nuda]QDU90791.1 hypothetical protein Pla175_42040 [Pirellulimonas nuda]